MNLDSNRTRWLKKRAGLALVEMVVALSLILSAIGLGASAWAQAVNLRQLRDRRDAAREAVTAGLERVRALDNSRLPKSGEKLDIGFPKEFTTRLAGAHCMLTIAPVAEYDNLRRVRLEVEWKAGQVESGEIILPAPHGKAAP